MNSIVNRLTVVCRNNSNPFLQFVHCAAARQLLTKRGICLSPITCSSAADNNNKLPDKPIKKSRLADNWGSKKAHRKVKLNFFANMSDPKTEEILAPLRSLVKEQVSCFAMQGSMKLCKSLGNEHTHKCL